MKSIVFVLLFACTAVLGSEPLQCDNALKDNDVSTEWIDMVDECTRKMKAQFQEELKAAMKYVVLAAHFAKDTVNRPGFAKMFFEAASEERQHALKLSTYLAMRGQDASQLVDINELIPRLDTIQNGTHALEIALDMEVFVTESIKNVIKTCETARGFNDYHLVDYLTGDFLTEQYNGERDIAGKISVLKRMIGQHPHLGEFLFDKKLLSGDL